MDSVRSFTHSLFYNVGLQFSYRIFTFILNATLLRIISKEVLGIANVRLMLLYTTATFLAREPFRRACSSEHKYVSQGRVNVLWLCPLVCFPVCLVLCTLWIYVLPSPPPEYQQSYTHSVFMYAGAVFMESLVEPLWIIAQTKKMVSTKAVIEAIQIFSRNVICFALVYKYRDWNLYAFSASVVISSFLYVLLYVYSMVGLYLTGKIKILLPKMSVAFERESSKLLKSFWTHSIMKQFLTEGERYIMTCFNLLDFGDQGVYDIIHNLGSLVARIVFAPLEQSAYDFFSWTIRRSVPAIQQDQKNFEVASHVLAGMLKGVTLVGLLISTFGCFYSYLALDLYGGDMLSSGQGPVLLRVYCFYVFLLALNGITECFSFAAMNDKQVNKHKLFLGVNCVVFLMFTFLLTHLFGPVGFLLANCINMMLRILYSCIFISQFYSTVEEMYSPLHCIFPCFQVGVMLVISFLFTGLSCVIFGTLGISNRLAHVSVGAVFFLFTLLNIYMNETDFVTFCQDYIFHSKRLQHKTK